MSTFQGHFDSEEEPHFNHARAGGKCGWGHALMFLPACLSFGWHSAASFTEFFLSHLIKDRKKDVQNCCREGQEWWDKWEGVFWEEFLIVCLFSVIFKTLNMYFNHPTYISLPGFVLKHIGRVTDQINSAESQHCVLPGHEGAPVAT